MNKMTFERNGTKTEIDILDFQLGMHSDLELPASGLAGSQIPVENRGNWTTLTVMQKYDENACMMEEWRDELLENVQFLSTHPDNDDLRVFDITFSALRWESSSMKFADTAKLYSPNAAYAKDQMAVQVLVFTIEGDVSFEADKVALKDGVISSEGTYASNFDLRHNWDDQQTEGSNG